MGQRRRPANWRRLPRAPLLFVAFSPFTRFLLFARSSSVPNAISPDPSPSSKSPVDVIVDPKPPKAIERIEFSEDEEEEQEMVQADFEFFDPKPGDFNGVKLLLQNYLDNKPWDLSGFVDLIQEQTTVGTIVKSAGQDKEAEGDDDGLHDD